MTDTISIEEAVLDWLREYSEPKPASMDSETRLLDLEVLDSLSILQLVGYLEQRFDVNMPLEEFVPDNFATPKTVAEMVARQFDPAA